MIKWIRNRWMWVGVIIILQIYQHHIRCSKSQMNLFCNRGDLFQNIGISYAQNVWVINEKLMFKINYLWIMLRKRKCLDLTLFRYKYAIFIYMRIHLKFIKSLNLKLCLTHKRVQIQIHWGWGVHLQHDVCKSKCSDQCFAF